MLRHSAGSPSRLGSARGGRRDPGGRDAAGKAGPTRNIRLLVEYEGTRYSGWQVQDGQRTVAGELLTALRAQFNETPKLVGAGRTDQGVHAEGQVANFFTRVALPAPGIAE
ncbi:MAG TPA: hypothetical protein VEO94_04105, partial [Candidatus Dormibacteraeota bacterium]|nr:hypothetical protein [Candidatus Dormibacteraeota bacterium]